MKRYFYLAVLMLFCVSTFGQIQVRRSGGWLETAFIEWELYAGADMYNVYYKESAASQWTKIDKELVRNYGYYGRADVLGISAGVYDIKVVATSEGIEIGASSVTINNVGVEAHDRSGFAFMNGVVPGAYKADGTLKEGAKVFYVDNSNFNTIEWEVNKDAKGTKQTCVGVQGILAESVLKNMAFNDFVPICIRIIGEINTTGFPSASWGSSAEGLSIKGDKDVPMNITVEGVGEDACVNGFGIFCRSSNSVELRNLGVMNVKDDDVSLDTDNYYTWVHNLDLYYGKAGSDSDQAKGDGTVDVKGNSKYQTYSYNHFWDSGKCSLCGMSSESGPNYITYHHNWFDHSDSRHPRVRTMTVHVYNNYYDGVAKYGVGATTGSNIFVESNYFRNCNRPMMSSKQGTDATGDGTFSGESGGMIKAYGNQYVECGKNFSYITANEVSESAATGVSATSFDAYEAVSRNEQVPSSYKTVSGGTSYSNFDTDSKVMPSYTADKAVEVPAKVKKYAGRLNGGDIVFVFNNAEDDASYAVNSALKTMITNYKTSLVSVATFAKTTAKPTTYKVTFLNEDGTEFAVIRDLVKVIYPEDAPKSDDITMTFTGWNVARGTVLTSDIEVVPSFSDGSNTEGEGVGGIEVINNWDFTSWSSTTQAAVRTWVDKGDNTDRWQNASALSKSSLGITEADGLLWTSNSKQVTVSLGSKGKYIQTSALIYIPAKAGETLTIGFSNTGGSNGTRYLMLNGATNIGESASSEQTNATINVTEEMLTDGYLTIQCSSTSGSVSASSFNYYSIKRTLDVSNLQKPKFKYSAPYIEIDLVGEDDIELPMLTNGSDNENVIYKSSDETVATISEDGQVVLKNMGTTVITAFVEKTNTYRAATAKYTLKVLNSSIASYTVTYMSEGTEFAVMPEQYTVVYPEDAPEKEGFAFVGWSVQEGAVLTGNTTIEAIFEALATYTVKFLNADGSIFEQMDGQLKVEYPTTMPTKDGYTFKGWNIAEGTTLSNDIEVEPTFEVMKTINYLLYAKSKNTYDDCSGFYTMNGTITKDKSLTYNGKTYSPCITTDSKCNITFTAPADMTMVIVMLTEGNIKLNGVATGKSTAEGSYYVLEIDLTANTQYTISKGSSEIQIGCLYLSPLPNSTPIENIEAEKEVVSVEYYGINGEKKREAKRGLNIIKTTYTDGTSEVKRVLKK